MKLLEAAKIIGSLGGRPRSRPVPFTPYYGGSNNAIPVNVYTTESFIPYTDETGLNFYLTET